MKGHIINLEKVTLENEKFRQVLYTGRYCQLVLMSLKPGEDIGEEVHGLDQFIRIEKGIGKAVLDGVEHELGDGFSIIIPASTRHNIINTSQDEPLKLYTLYSPPNHKDQTIHGTKEEVEEEQFDGKTTE